MTTSMPSIEVRSTPHIRFSSTFRFRAEAGVFFPPGLFVFFVFLVTRMYSGWETGSSISITRVGSLLI